VSEPKKDPSVFRGEFLGRIERSFARGWQEHESAAWRMNEGGCRLGEPDFAHESHVTSHLTAPSPGPIEPGMGQPMWWEWEVKCQSGGAFYRAFGYVRSKDEGKQRCRRAVIVIANGVLADWETIVAMERAAS
jgi:hypothetical protein